MRSIVFTFLIFQFSVCFAQQTIYDTIVQDSLDRAYILYVPASYDSAVATPLLFNFHGYGSNSYEQMYYGDFRKLADTFGFIVAHPMGTLDNTNTAHWNVGWGASTTDDVGFVNNLIDSLRSNYNIDSNRIYSTGMSNGGYMSYLLACQLSNKIAAIASVTGSMASATMTNCNPLHPTPIMQIHGTADPTVPYYGSGSWTKGIEVVVNYWKDFNQTQFEQIDTLPNISTTDGSTVVRFRNTHGDSCVDVVLYKVLSGKHTWPGSAFGGAGTNNDFDASKAVWEFVSQFDINGRIDTCPSEPLGVAESVINSLKVFPNPSNGQITIELNEPSADIAITNELGVEIKTLKNAPKTVVLELKTGIYFISTQTPRGVQRKKVCVIN